MALDPKPRGMIWVSASDYATIKSGSHKPSFSVLPTEEVKDMKAWFLAYASSFRSNYMYYLSASQLTAKDPSDTGVKAILETEEAGKYAYMCFEDLDMTKFTDGQFNLVKQLVEKQYTVKYATYTGVQPNGAPDSMSNVDAEVLSVSVVLPPIRSAWNGTAPYALAMTTTLCTIILKFKSTTGCTALAPITVVASMTPPRFDSPPTNTPDDYRFATEWLTYYQSCTEELANAVDTAIGSSQPLPAVPTTHGTSTGTTTGPVVNFKAKNQSAAITVNLSTP